MGLYNTFEIDTNLLPVTDAEKQKIGVCGEDVQWQTKSLTPSMSHYVMTNKGQLQAHLWEVGMKNGRYKRINERWEDMDYTGIVNFYSDIGEEADWYEFDAHFIGGKLDKIEGGYKDKIDWIDNLTMKTLGFTLKDML